MLLAKSVHYKRNIRYESVWAHPQGRFPRPDRLRRVAPVPGELNNANGTAVRNQDSGKAFCPS